jgi:hypothetical protein
MSYFIFIKNSDNIEGTLYRIAENESDLNNLMINKSDYKIIEDSQENFNAVKLNTKIVLKYNGDVITYLNIVPSFKDKISLSNYIEDFKNRINKFNDNNKNHPLFNVWNNHYNQLNSLNLDNFTYPLNKSLEQYFNDLCQSSLSPLQLS